MSNPLHQHTSSAKAERYRNIKRLEGEAYVGPRTSATPLRNYAPQTELHPFHFGKRGAISP